ncbi:MAG TPA: hypothetical protein VIY86_10370, partial [Pirellulaceae bacterium]
MLASFQPYLTGAVLVALALSGLARWRSERPPRWGDWPWPVALALLLGLAQLVNLPNSLLGVLSPIARDSWQMANSNASAALESESSHGSSCVSLHPWRTRESLGQLAMLLAVYHVAVTTCRSRERVVWFLGLVAVNGALLTLFGLV